MALLLAVGLGRAIAGEYRSAERTTPTSSIRVELPPCIGEDPDHCLWKADQQGNGIGHSYMVDAHGTLIHLEGKS